MTTTSESLSFSIRDSLGVDLPEGWTWTKVRDVIERSQYGTSTKAEADGKTGVPLLRMGNIQDGSLNLDHLKYIALDSDELDKLILRSGDILFNRTNSPELVGKAAVFNSDLRATFASYLIRLRCEGRLVLPIYLCRWINSRWGKEWAQAVRTDGVSQSNINSTKLLDMEIPLPPPEEQKRIVERVEALLTRVNAARGRLDKVPAILKRFRQSVLAAAFSEGDEIELDSVLEGIRYGTSVKCSRVQRGTPVLRIPNVAGGMISHEDLKYGPLSAKERTTLKLEQGDLLMIRSNGSVALVGRTAVVTARDKGFAYAGYLMRLRLIPGKALPEYVNLALRAYDARVQIELPARSTSGVNNINSEEVRRLKIRLPSLATQQGAVRHVGALFRLADEIERRVSVATRRVQNLTQAILAKAFRGEVVPTEAELARCEGREYEPASALLARMSKIEQVTKPETRAKRKKGSRQRATKARS